MINMALNFGAMMMMMMISVAAGAPVLRATPYDMTLYVHVNITAGPNKGDPTVAGLNGTKSDGMSFGTIIVMDGLVTEGSTANTTAVGRFQGFYANVAIARNNLLLPASFIFQNRQFNGSTIEILGSNRQDLTVRSVSVVGGTGVFSFATGTADISLYYLDPNSMYTLMFHLKFYTPIF